MKTRKQKVICRVLCMVVSIFLLASFFVMPVMALDEMSTVVIENIMYDFGSDHHDPDQRPYSSLYVGYVSGNQLKNFDIVNSNSQFWEQPDYVYNEDSFLTFDYSEPYYPQVGTFKVVYYINLLFDDGVARTFSQGDTCYIEPGSLGCWFDTEASFSNYRFVLRDGGDNYDFAFGRVVASTDTVSINFDDSDDYIDYDRLAFNFVQDVTSRYLCLCIEFTGAVDSFPFTFSIESSIFKIRYGSGVSPNYPIYPAAPGGNDVGNYGSAEQQLIQSQEQGLSQGANSMQSVGSNLQSLSSDLKLMSFVPVLSGALDKIATIPGIMPLVNISLSLGLFASLMGLAASIVSAADRRAGQAKREAAAKERSDYYKSR